ncbi:hypothetical protein AVO45_15450 [Ruegeria marisrubri]|uniref:Uncharacterized protein n=1 Tax=Ruegeria marisrubri TaxID=1685379 RepID=A0A0X3TCR0_9RHOB|nr:hypothetical protein [Ruegeria marisrubri]KUJ73473.1 hypothetical protein AVO45_15450 [Ruegeria marisrubri]
MSQLKRPALIGAVLAFGLQLASAPATADAQAKTHTFGETAKIITLGISVSRFHGESQPRVHRHHFPPTVHVARKQARKHDGRSAVPYGYQQPGYRQKKRYSYQRSKRHYFYGSQPHYRPRLDRYPRYNYGFYPSLSQLRRPYRQRSSYRLHYRWGH